MKRDYEGPEFSGAGGGGKSGSDDDPNSLKSNATATFVDLLGEGEIKGLVNGDKGVFFGDTPLRSEDGNLNFQGVTLTTRLGTPDQQPMPGNKVETEITVGAQVKKNVPITRNLTDPDYTSCRVTIRIPTLARQTDKGMKAYNVQLRIEVMCNGGSWISPFGDISIEGKNTSPYDKAYLFGLPTNPTGDSFPWSIRVTRLSDDNDDDIKNQNDTYFEAMTGIIDEQLIYPDSALVGMVIDSKKFGQAVDERSYLVDGLLTPVPTNYDPVARTYSGDWDGTFKTAWHQNPAWAFYDVVTQKRYGLGEFIDAAIVDKWTMYTIGKYCDERVSDGYGGTEARFSINGDLSEEKDCYEFLQSMAAIFRGLTYWSSGLVTAAQDAPKNPELLVTNQNVEKGMFNYSSTALPARHTVVEVTWRDPKDLYKQAVEVVRDTDAVLRYGVRTTKVNAPFCTSRGEAHRIGTWTLFTEQVETQVVNYTAGFDHAFLTPGSIVEIFDKEVANVDLSGRVKSRAGTTFTLDRTVTLEAGKTYTLLVTKSDMSTASMEVTTGAGSHNTITVSSIPAGATFEPGAIWAMTHISLSTTQYRIMTLEEKEPGRIDVSALEYQPGKFATIDSGKTFDPPTIRQDAKVLPPTNLSASASHHYVNGVPQSVITFSWTPPTGVLLPRYNIQVVTPNSGTLSYFNVVGTTFEIGEADNGTYTFHIQTVGLKGQSTDASLTFVCTGWGGESFSVTDLVMTTGPGATNFTGRDVSFAWKNHIGNDSAPTSNPLFQSNHLSIYDGDTGTLLREETVYNTTYTYTLEKNQQDNSDLSTGKRAARTIRFVVYLTLVTGDISPPVEITVTNPAPAAPTVELDAGAAQFVATISQSLDDDFAGNKIWVSKTNPPSTLVPPDYDGKAPLFLYQGDPDTFYYVIVGQYDVFDSTPVNFTSVLQVKTLNNSIDVTPPAVPTGLALSQRESTDSDGVVTRYLVANWDANTEDDMGRYDILVKEGAGNFVSFVTATNSYEWAALSGLDYTVELRAVDTSGNASNYCDAVTYTMTGDTTPPAVPQNLVAQGGFGLFWLTWDANTESDLVAYDIYMSDTNAAPDGTTIPNYVSTTASAVIGGQPNQITRYFWVRARDRSDNASDWSDMSSATTGATAAAIEYDFQGVTFSPDEATDTLSWTAGTVIYGAQGSAPTQVNLDAGSATWTTGKLYVYYANGDTELSTTTDLVAAYTDGHLVGIYSGGTDFQLTEGKVYQDGALLIAGTVGAAQLDTQNAVITGTAQIADEIVTSAKIASLDAGKITAGTALAGSITVSGQALSTTVSNANTGAQDPASRINSGVTKIDPGKVYIGSNTLAGAMGSFTMGGDYTTINGGAIAANTIKANSAVFGLRAIGLQGLQFTANSPAANQVSWTGGTLTYTNDAGSVTGATIAAGSATYTGVTAYIYYTQGASVLSVTTDVNVAHANTNALIALYQGGTSLTVNAGQTIIDGDHIKTGTITAQQCDVASLRAGILTANVISGNMIQAGAITADKMVIGNSANLILSNADFRAGLTDWAIGPYNPETGDVSFYPTYAGVHVNPYPEGSLSASDGSIEFYQSGANGGNWVYAACQQLTCQAGQRYQFSMYVGQLNMARDPCCQLQLQFFDSSGAELPGLNVFGNASQIGRPGSLGIAGYTRIGGFVVAPAGAVSMALRLFKTGSYGSGAAHLWACRPMIATALPNQTVLSDWSSGAKTLIGPGYINVVSLDAISGNFGTITAGMARSTDSKMQVDLNNKRILIGD